jgi:hypothetical protein
MVKKNSEKYLNAKASLPADLRPVYEDMVEQYSFHTQRLFGRGYVAYEVLASLVRDGWRCSADPQKKP